MNLGLVHLEAADALDDAADRLAQAASARGYLLWTGIDPEREVDRYRRAASQLREDAPRYAHVS